MAGFQLTLHGRFWVIPQGTCDCPFAWLDHALTLTPYDNSDHNPRMPATFVFCGLMRDLILESKSHALKKGDGMDFSHAVLASTFASVGTLDRHWKRRVENLPKPNRLAPIYSSKHLDQMVVDIESKLRSRKAESSGSW